MSVQTEIDRLQTAKSDLRTAIEGKGVAVPDVTRLDGYGALVRQISSGGGGGIQAFSFEKEIGTSTLVIRRMDGQTLTLASAADSQTVGGIFFSYNKMNWSLSAAETVFYDNQVYFAGEFIVTCMREQSGMGGWLQFSS